MNLVLKTDIEAINAAGGDMLKSIIEAGTHEAEEIGKHLHIK